MLTDDPRREVLRIFKDTSINAVCARMRARTRPLRAHANVRVYA